MDELRRMYRAALPGRIADLEAARAALAGHSPPPADAAETIRRIAHSLRGSGGTYGFPAISTAAAAVEEAGAPDFAARVDELLTLLHATAAGHDAPA